MKKIILTLSTLILASLAANAQFRTADNVDYIIVVRSDYNVQQCATEIYNLAKDSGTGYFQVLETLGIVMTNMDSKAAYHVSQLACVEVIEEDEEVSL